MKMTRDELEYAISQYLDGNLPALEVAALEERLAGDAEARAMLEEYRRLNTVLKASLPVPAVEWDHFAARVQASLADEETPVRHYSIRSIGWIGRAAIAASLLFAVSLTLFLINTPAAPQGSVVVSGPSAEQSAGPVVAEISIGPSPAVARDWRAGQEVVSRPAIVLIDRVSTSGQDTDSSWY